MRNTVIAIIAILPMSLMAAYTSDNMSEVERDAKALELFLQDRHDHEKHCPFRTWEQPDISVYKETLASHLPEGCKE